MPRIQIYDTTLRDGSQAEGISFSLQDKLAITERLDQPRLRLCRGRLPGLERKDAQYFQRVCELPLKHVRVCAFGMTRRKGVKAADDEGLRALLDLPRQDDHHRRQELALPGDRGPPHQRRRKPGDDPREHRPPGRPAAAR